MKSRSITSFSVKDETVPGSDEGLIFAVYQQCEANLEALLRAGGTVWLSPADLHPDIIRTKALLRLMPELAEVDEH